jgi:flavodoxin
LAEELQQRGHSTEIMLARDVKSDNIKNADLVILASPSWDYSGQQGMPHEDYETFSKNIGADTFPGKKFAIMGLGDMNYTYFCGAVGHIEEMVAKLQGELVTESLKLDQFYIYEQENTVKIKQWAAQLAKTLS